MSRYFFLLFVVFTASSLPGFAQQGDTLVYRLKEVEVTDKHKWTNDTAAYRFNQMRYYVQIVLPYVNAASDVFRQIDAKVGEGLSRRDRKRYVAAREEELRTRFEDKVKDLNETQGLLLIKLIARQTGVNIYQILQEFKNPLTALKWQAWAKMHGFNLNKRYDPEKEVLLEQVMFSLGYDLPAFYNQPASATALSR